MSIDPETLMAYADGECDPTDRVAREAREDHRSDPGEQHRRGAVEHGGRWVDAGAGDDRHGREDREDGGEQDRQRERRPMAQRRGDRVRWRSHARHAPIVA